MPDKQSQVPNTLNIACLEIHHSYTDLLPSDTETLGYPRQVFDAAYSYVMPTPVSQPKLIAVSKKLSEQIGFHSNDNNNIEFSELFCGNKIIPGMRPFSCNYGGHQFGHWAGQLGDGRAITLGNVKTAEGNYLYLQLKGAGLTPYSRTADGRAVLRSSIREFLCSEAMYHLGIPTTRALTLCLTGDMIVRDMFYDGNAKPEPGAIVCRTSQSFTRFGTFQLPASRQEFDLLDRLIQQCIQYDYPHLGDPKDHNVRLNWFNEICDRTCDLIIHWQRVGFVHGVMNTDNMSIIGETIDYGPYGWIDNYDPDWTPNTTDFKQKRYRFGNQGNVALWNLYQLANALQPLLNDASALEASLTQFQTNYQTKYEKMMANKLGLIGKREEDNQLIEELERLLTEVETDMTLFFRQLARLTNVSETNVLFSDCYYQPDQLTEPYLHKLNQWISAYLSRIEQNDEQHAARTKRMNRFNPKYVLRNYLSQQAIDLAEQGDYSMIYKLQKMLLNPYDEQPEFEQYALKRPEWARNKPGSSTLSCSS